jgi:RNA polymerase sigma factor (TIGR02999 family)
MEAVTTDGLDLWETPHAEDGELPEIYSRLKQMARAKLMRFSNHHSLHATDLVHIAWMKLQPGRTWKDERHFFAYAATVMRNILVDRARKRQRVSHGGHLRPLDIDSVEIAEECSDDQLLMVEEALECLKEVHPQHAKLIHLRFFIGMTTREIAGLMELSESSIKRMLVFARAWLVRFLQNNEESRRV